jgi:hypothetical protein
MEAQKAGRAWGAIQAIRAQWPELATAWANLRRR